jgi:DNA-binding transcriptional ArsR family regulator
MADARDDSQPDGFVALAHPLRRQILELLAEAERPVGDIAARFAVTRPAVSQHLRILLDAGLVSERRRGRERLYRLRPEGVREVYDWLAHYRRFWDERLVRLAQHLDEEDDER